MSWDTIIADPEFQALEPDRKQKIANNYFAKNFESDKDFISLPEEKRFKIKSNFESTLNIEKPLPSRGLFMDVATAPVRGLVNAAETYGRAARTIDPEGGRDFVRDIGTKVVGLTEKVREKAPYIFKPSKESEKGIIRKAITEGTESFAHSLATGLPGAIVGAVGGIPGMIAGYAASGGTLFGLAEYDQFLEEASSAINERKDLTPEEKTALIEKAKPFARKSALVEGGFEFASDLTEGLTMKIGTPFTKLAKGSVRSYLTTTPKQVLLNMAKVASIETPTEMTQAYLETGLRQKAGIETGLTPKQAAVEVVGPTLFSSILFGALGSRFDYKQKQKIRNALIDPKVDIAEREGAINAVAPILSKVNKPFAETWTLNALNSVAQRKSIDIDIPFEKIAKPKATGLKLEQPAKAEVPKFDATPDIKTTGQGLKIEPIIEKPIKKPVVSHEEDIIVKGEKPVTLEKPVSKPITEGLPIEKEIPVTLTPKEKPRGIIPTKEIWDKTPADVQNEWSDVIDYLEDARKEYETNVKPLKTALSLLKGRGNKERKDELKAQIDELTAIYESIPGGYERKSYDVSNELRGEAIGKARKAGLTDEDILDNFADDFLLESSPERPYIEVNYDKTTQQIFDEVLDRYLTTQKPKEVIASEETKGQEAQRGLLPLKPMSFTSVEDARSWIKQKSKEYGGRNQFLASKEYETAYPEVKRVFDEQKQKNKEQAIEANKVRIKKEEDGTFSLNFVQRPDSYVASSGGLYGGKATYKTEAEAIEKAKKLNLTIVPKQGTSPETKGLPTGEAAPVVSKESWQMTSKEYYGEEKQIKLYDISKIDPAELPWTGDLPVSRDYLSNVSGDGKLSETKIVDVEDIESTEKTSQAQVDELKEYIKDTNNDLPPIVVERDAGGLFVVDGHNRFQAAKELGYTKIPVKEYELPADISHEQIVKQALSEGKPVPSEVLKDYPELQQTHTMPSGEVMPGAEHKEALTKEGEEYDKTVREREVQGRIPQREKPEQVPVKEGGRGEAERGRGIQAHEEKEIKEWMSIPLLDAEIRTIKEPTKNNDRWEIEIGVQESLGEQGGDIITRAYDNKPTIEEIKNDIIEHYKEEKADINKEVLLGITAKSGRDEIIEKAIDRVLAKTETPTPPISPIEAKIKKVIPEGESLTSRKQLAEQMKQSGMSDEEVEINIQLAVDAPAKALGITPDEFIQSYIGQVKASTMAELEGKKTQFQSQEQAQEFYSHLEDIIEKSSQVRYVPQQLLNYLKAQGVKDAEIEATGLKEYLKEKDNVSKDELLEYLKGNQVEIKVIEKGKARNIPSDLWFVEEGDIEKYTAEQEPNGTGSIVVKANSKEEARSIADRYDKNKLRAGDVVYKNANEISNAGLFSPTKFSQWVEPGGENYKEILLALPDRPYSQYLTAEEIELQKLNRISYQRDWAEEEKIRANILQREVGVSLVEKVRKNRPYKSPHYDEPNIVAHIRVNDRTDTNGKKVLFVEEIQSDWAADLKRGKEGVPQFPFSKTWHEIALKHVLRYASENGYDSIAWTTGGMQQNRYDLSKQVDAIQYFKYRNKDLYSLYIEKNGSVVKNLDISAENLSNYVGKDIAKKITDNEGISSGEGTKILSGLDLKVGGKWAERLYDEMIPQFLNKYTKKWGGRIGETKIDVGVKGTTYTGPTKTVEEITEYKRGIYSAVTNSAASDIIEAMQGGMPFQEAIKLYGSIDFANKIGGKLEWNRNIQKIQSLNITPSMRQSIMQEGQPLFQGNRGAIEFTKDGKAIIHILENADKSTFIHEMFHLYVDIMKRTPKLKAQLKILETWIGKPVDKWTVADNEKVAKGGEKYLWEGNAPTSALKAVFERFKTWLREVYKTAKSLDIKLSDDVRKMWDEWFGGKEVKIEVKQAESFTSDESMINSYGEKELRAIIEGVYRPKLKELAQKRLSKITESKPVVKSSIGTLDNIDTIALSDIFKAEIDRGTPLNKLLVKRIVAGKLGILVGDLTPEKGYKHKAVEEAYEYAIVKKGREIAQSDMSADEKFEATKNLYAQQLNLSERTSTSIEKQQYSTPLPLAMAINEHLGINKNTTVYEPTAGNGILLIGANPKKTVTNELATDYRQTHLKDTGFSTIQGDAMTFIKDTSMNKSFNTVVMNPPFGNAEVKLFDNYRVRKLEHQIALESLKAMEDNGNAAIIIGGHNFEHGKMTESDRIFLNYLYSHYNVTHNIDINGDVYRRMGTSFPIRLITIEGRKATPDNQFAPTEQSQVESANTFDDVRNRLGKPIQKEMEVKREDIGKEPITTRLPGKEGRGVEGVAEGRQKGDEPARGMRDITPRPGIPDTGFMEQPGYSKDIVGDIVREERGRGRTGTSPGVARGEGVRPEELPGQLPLSGKQPRLADANIQVPYVPKSKGKSGGNVIPKNLAKPIAKVLQKIEDTYGDIDNFIQKELQYKIREDLFDALSAEQIEDASIIISNIKNGKSTILGGQTGIGKGRTLSAIIRYANLQGIKPIFFTEKPNLFSDIYRDLVDIKHKVKPFVLHSSSNSTILDQEGNKVFKPSFVGESKTNIIKDPTKEMENYDMLITTYDQINKENKQRSVLRMLAQNNIIILDEAHKAAGASSTGKFMSKLLEGAKAVVYSSATYAKRPDNMAVYHKTDIGKTGLSVEGLTDAIKLGGIPLQQWVASALAEGGQYTRTELDYSGTNLDITLDTKNESLHTKQSDDITSILRDIVKFDKEKLKVIKEMDKEAVKEGKRTTGEDSTAAGVTSSNFSSVVHNMVGQLLLSLRADTLVDEVIASVKAGRKPAITVMNTMETFLKGAVDEGNVSIGDPIGFSFKDILKKALKGTSRYTEISPGGDRFKKVLKLEELPNSVQAIYQDIESKINSLETLLPSSPIDYVKSELAKAGYTVGEITGRKLYIDYYEKVPTLGAREESERRNRNAIINDYNSGKIKILIFNAAGATGISLHSSEKFATAKEQREMFIWQPQLNIDTFKQAMGRVFRKGQVSKPRFTMIQTALPAEIRPTVILQKKLASLNANTTANKESSAGLKDVPDMMNSYGDSVVFSYLKQNREINAMLGDPLDIEKDEASGILAYRDSQSDAMQKVTGKVALLPVQIQRQFYDDIEMAYKELIEHLDQIGENNLHTKEYNFQSKTLEKQITNQGKDESNPFASSTYLEKISVKVLKKPFTKAKIEELVKDSLKGKEAEAFNEELLSKIKEVTDQYKNTLEGELIEKRKEEIQYDINLIDYAFKKFKIGHSYSIPIIEDVYTPAVLVDIKHSKTSGNPAAPSKVHLVFAAAPPYQIYKTSLSRKEFISNADSTGEGIPSEWDELIPKEVRENRHVITGNLLQGFQRLGERAETINYTTESGEVKAGILLPRSTNINSLKEGGTTVGSKEAFDYLQSHNYIESPDKEVTIRVSKETVTINVPKSKSDGAKYYLNKPLLSLLEVEFSSFGNSMRSHVSIDKLLPLLETLEQETSTRFSIPAKEVAPSETVTEKKEGEETSENVGKVFFQEAHKEDFIKNVVDKFSNWNEEKKAYKEAVDNGLIKEDISDDFRNKVKQWVSFPRTVAKKYPVFKRFYDRAEKYFEDVDNYATTMGNTVKPYMDATNQETVNKLLIDARLNKKYAYSKEELQKAGHSEEVIKEYLSVVNTMNQGLHYMANMLNRSGNDIEEIYTFVSKVKGMRNLLKPYKALENKDNINKVLSGTVWGKKVFRKQELIDMGLTEEERLAYNSITKLMFKNSNYVPFKRYGDWFVAVNDAEGNLVEYSFHESHKEMRAEALAMVEKYPGNKVTSGNVKKLATEAYQNMPVSILTMLKEFDEQLDTEFSKVYANITGRGFPLHLIESKKILGFEKDLSKSISDYILGISKWMASKEARHDFSKMFVEKDAEGKLLLDPRKQAQLYGYTDRYVNYILGNSKEGSRFRQFMFRYYLGGVVKSAMLNFTQSLTTTLPTSAKYIEGSIIRRSRLMADAIKTAAIPIDKLKTIDPQLAEALQKALKDGKISEQMVKMLRGEVYGRKLNKLDKILSYMFEFAEQSNRKIAFIMAYNEAITNGVKTKGRKGGYQVLGYEEAVRFAEDFVDETQFVYSKLNKSELMRGWKAPLFTFRVFAGSYLSLLKGMILEGEWKALSELLGVMLLLGGLAAFPGLKEIEKALELMGYDPKKGIKKKFGQWGDLSLHGVLYPLGIDLSGALGTIEIVPGDIQQGIVPAVGGLILGVPMDIPKRMGRAWTLLTKNKDVYRAVEAIMPEAIRNPMVAVRWIKEGEAKSATYEPITKVGGLDTALKFLGIQPATLSKAYEREHSESILRNINYSEGYNWRIAKALYKKDSDEFKDILEEIRKHNARIGKAIAGGDKEAVRKYILPTRQGIQRNLLKMISPQASELKSMPKVLRPAYREIQEVMK